MRQGITTLGIGELGGLTAFLWQIDEPTRSAFTEAILATVETHDHHNPRHALLPNDRLELQLASWPGPAGFVGQ